MRLTEQVTATGTGKKTFPNNASVQKNRNFIIVYRA